jgi:hypothetical protein
MAGTTRCEWFKLFLEPNALRDESAIDPRLPTLPVSERLIHDPLLVAELLFSQGKRRLT